MTPRLAMPTGNLGTMAQQGFSLIEVLVALAIVAVALAACMRATGQMADTHAQLRNRSLALVSAENVLAELRATRTYPALGSQRAPCPQGALVLVCEREVSGTANNAFRQVTVRVTEGPDGPLLAELRSLASAWP
ncbi:General secretion pathway protein I [plant metagenome]|uniref:Type II secretion system protein I n=2 Tax=root TaxID=1 RepID=A0A1C3K5A0_9BURK|nr:type II secretion system minor pseudopilin GspI [Orrella dioscoreae]SBT26686.1 General secretion pathway protein I [Orrella dioscoreae]SOE49415.1 General secretion pathway protein I [Orrella dioscoreae]